MKEAYCDNCGESFDVGATVYDGDDFECPDCGYTVSATVDENGMIYWNTFAPNGEMI